MAVQRTFDGKTVPVGFVWGTEQERLCEAASKAAEVADVIYGLLDKMIEKINEQWSDALGQKVDRAANELIFLPLHLEHGKYRREFTDFEYTLGVQGIFKGIQLFDTRNLHYINSRHPSEELFIPSVALENVTTARFQGTPYKKGFVPLDKVYGPVTVLES